MPLTSCKSPPSSPKTPCKLSQPPPPPPARRAGTLWWTRAAASFLPTSASRILSKPPSSKPLPTRAGLGLCGGRGRGRVLRPQDRHQDPGRAGPQVAVLHRAGAGLSWAGRGGAGWGNLPNWLAVREVASDYRHFILLLARLPWRPPRSCTLTSRLPSLRLARTWLPAHQPPCLTDQVSHFHLSPGRSWTPPYLGYTWLCPRGNVTARPPVSVPPHAAGLPASRLPSLRLGCLSLYPPAYMPK